jgi:hypothetical protein
MGEDEAWQLFGNPVEVERPPLEAVARRFLKTVSETLVCMCVCVCVCVTVFCKVWSRVLC